MNSDSVKLLTELWIQDRKEFIYKNTDIDGKLSETVEKAVQKRKGELNHLKCKDFNWYIRYACFKSQNYLNLCRFSSFQF